MDLVQKFKEKVEATEQKEGLKYDFLYAGYEKALQNNRLLCFWHPVGTELCKISDGNSEVVLKITGDLKGCALEDAEGGEVLDTFDGAVSPSVKCATDNELSEIMLAPKDGVIYEFDNLSNLALIANGKESPLVETSIAKAVFNIKDIKAALATISEDDDVPEKMESEKPESKEEAPSEKPKAKPKATKTKEKKPAIKDSGNRTEFASGAVRDIQTGKGRCDLLPLDIVGEFFECVPDKSGFEEISLFQEDHDRSHLVKAAKVFAADIFPDDETAILEYACHLEDGCMKYGDRNWEKGIPLSRFIDSGIRHFLKFRRGDDDERHDRAFIWNMLCGAWTCKHHPDLIEQ